MTAKELLRERIEALSEEEAAEALELLGFEDSLPWQGFPPAPRRWSLECGGCSTNLAIDE